MLYPNGYNRNILIDNIPVRVQLCLYEYRKHCRVYQEQAKKCRFNSTRIRPESRARVALYPGPGTGQRNTQARQGESGARHVRSPCRPCTERTVNRRGIVYKEDFPAGIIAETEQGYEFTYTENWLTRPDARPISLTLPLSERPYVSSTFIPFFDGLIPEGWLLDIAVHNWKLDPRDRMGLLLTVCRDCIGDVSIIPETRQ